MNRIISPKYADDTVMDILRREKVYLVCDCGGAGSCGKCRVKFFDAGKCPEPQAADKEMLTEQEIEDGFRLACQAKISDEEEIMIPEESLIKELPLDAPREITSPTQSEIVAVDLGTSVLSGALVDLNQGVTAKASTINHQKAYGADVLSRVKASVSGYGEELRLITLDDIYELTERLGRDPERMRYIISGNTVMQHILSGFSLKGFMGTPYEPVDISMRRDGNMTMLPGISCFVGADIVSGILASSLDKAEKPWLYVDIGTNGEMAIGTGSDVIVTSSPAGPAFEGGALSCGMPAAKGAVERVEISGDLVSASVAGGGDALGICGSGAIETVSELFDNGIIDENGTMDERYAGSSPFDGYPLTPDVLFTMNDVREVQKAKAAIRAGIEVLIKESGVRRDEIDKLVIAGSFGSGLDMEKACNVGLIPLDLLGNAALAGNASLLGATLYALDTGFGDRCIELAGKAKEIQLSLTQGFEPEYYRAMELGKR